MIWFLDWALLTLGVGYFAQWSRIPALVGWRRRTMRTWAKGPLECFACLHGHVAWMVAIVCLVCLYAGATGEELLLWSSPVSGVGFAQGLRLMSPLAAAAALHGEGPLAKDLHSDEEVDDGS